MTSKANEIEEVIKNLSASKKDIIKMGFEQFGEIGQFGRGIISRAITDEFHIIPKTDSPATWVTIDEVTIKKADEAIVVFSAKLKWKENK